MALSCVTLETVTAAIPIVDPDAGEADADAMDVALAVADATSARTNATRPGA